VVTLSKKYPQRRVTENQNPNNPVNPEGDSTVNGAKEGQL